MIKTMSCSTVMLALLLPGLNLHAQMGGSLMGVDDERSEMAMNREAMRERCEKMQERMQQMQEHMDAMDEELQAQVEAIDEAEGDAKIEAMADAIRTLADQRQQRMQRRHEMMSKMRAHMGEHLSVRGNDSEKHRMMMNCPMMRSSDNQRPHRHDDE